jgi:hypothetical protein
MAKQDRSPFALRQPPVEGTLLPDCPIPTGIPGRQQGTTIRGVHCLSVCKSDKNLVP